MKKIPKGKYCFDTERCIYYSKLKPLDWISIPFCLKLNKGSVVDLIDAHVQALLKLYKCDHKELKELFPLKQLQDSIKECE